MSVSMAKTGQMQANSARPGPVIEPDIHTSATSQQHVPDAKGANPGVELPLVRWSSASVEADAFEDTNLAEFMTARLPPTYSLPAVGPPAAPREALDNPLHRWTAHCLSSMSVCMTPMRSSPGPAAPQDVGSCPLCL